MADETTNNMQGGNPEEQPPIKDQAPATGSDAAASAQEGAENVPPQAPPTDAAVNEAPPKSDPPMVENRPRQAEQPSQPEARRTGRPDRGQRQPRGRRGQRGAEREERSDGLDDVVVKIYRCATVVKGGRRFSFSAMVVVGDRNGRVGIGYGKANEVPSAVEKANKAARRNMIEVKLESGTIPHQVMARFGASKVLLLPAGEGTGVIAGASVRAVMELAGIRNVLTKSYGSNSPKNLVKATFDGLKSLRNKEDVARLREVSIS